VSDLPQGWRGRFGWLINSLDHRAKEMRRHAARVRRAYLRDGPMGDVATILANTYDIAAAHFEARLAEVRATVELADKRGEL
jgi:hypothetical protein